jgi:hypothetical protein
MRLNEQFCRTVRDYIEDEIRGLILDTSFRFKVERVDLIQRKMKSGARYIPLFNARIRTNNRPLLLGQFLYFPVNGYRGFHNNWIEAHVHGLLKGRFHIQEPFAINVDVYPTRMTTTAVLSDMRLDSIVEKGILDKRSPLVVKMRKYGLNDLLVAGSQITGPDIDSMEMLERLLKQLKVRRMLDLFSGTGALSKVALVNGVEEVTTVDSSCSVARRTLRGFERRVRFIESDIFSMKGDLRGTYDLIVADPFIDYSLRFAEELAPLSARVSDNLQMTMGFVENTYWTSRVAKSLRRSYDSVSMNNQGRLVFAVCRSR